MKIRIQKDPTINGMIVSYFKIKDINKFRYGLLKGIVEREGKDITILIDTNQHKRVIEFDEISAYLKRQKVSFTVKEIPANETKLFGISMSIISKKKREPECLFALSLSPERFNQAIFDAVLSNYDMAIGLGRKIEFEQIMEKAAGGLQNVLFNQEVFENSLYDSALFESLRATMDIEEPAKSACADS